MRDVESWWREKYSKFLVLLPSRLFDLHGEIISNTNPDSLILYLVCKDSLVGVPFTLDEDQNISCSHDFTRWFTDLNHSNLSENK